MKRRFALPMVIAVTVEAVVLLCFNKPVPVSATPTSPPVLPPVPVPPVDETLIAPSPDDQPDGEPSRAHSTLPMIPEPPVQTREIITIELPIRQQPSQPQPKQTKVTLPSGTPDGRGDGPLIINIASLDNVPRASIQRPPKYPYGAIQNGQSGEVVVEFIVDFNGRVLNAHVVSSSSFIFEEPTLQAVGQWRFEPGRRYGKPVRFRMMVPVEFHLGQE
jgi:protein TonB